MTLALFFPLCRKGNWGVSSIIARMKKHPKLEVEQEHTSRIKMPNPLLWTQGLEITQCFAMWKLFSTRAIPLAKPPSFPSLLQLFLKSSYPQLSALSGRNIKMAKAGKGICTSFLCPPSNKPCKDLILLSKPWHLTLLQPRHEQRSPGWTILRCSQSSETIHWFPKFLGTADP